MLPERLPGQGAGAVGAASLSVGTDAAVIEHERVEQVRRLDTAVTDAYGGYCRRAGERGAAVRSCARALAHLVAERTPVRVSCSGQSAACARAARSLLRRLSR
jgi:hypothetical protein